MDDNFDSDLVCSKSNRRLFFKSLVITSAVTATTLSTVAQNLSNNSTNKPKPPKFELFVREQLEILNERTGENGFQSDVAVLRRRLEELQAQIDSCTNNIGSLSDIASVQKSLQEIKQALGIP